jgi:hypothetical protein
VENNIAEGELDDTGSSPVKRTDTHMQDRDSSDAGAKRRLALEEALPSETENQIGRVPMITDGTEILADANVGIEKDRNKRSKKDGADSPSLGSAGSLEESVRAQ